MKTIRFALGRIWTDNLQLLKVESKKMLNFSLRLFPVHPQMNWKPISESTANQNKPILKPTEKIRCWILILRF